MIYYLNYIKDTIGNNYIGINIYQEAVDPFINKMKNVVGDESDEYIKYQKDRDHGRYHITVINVMEYNRLSKEMGVDKFINSLELAFDYAIDDIKFMGLGSAERGGNKAFFVVIKSEKLKAIRDRYNLPEQDFHITIGFKYKDVFGVRKNEILPEVDPFLKLLKSKYYNNNESFDFVKEIDNFEGDKDADVEPIKIEDTSATFRIGKNNYYTIAFIGDELRVSANWSDNDDKPVMSNTLIYRKIKNV